MIPCPVLLILIMYVLWEFEMIFQYFFETDYYQLD